MSNAEEDTLPGCKVRQFSHHLVDHLPGSGSTHTQWWTHIREALVSIGESVDWVNPRRPLLPLTTDAQNVYWFFTQSSLTPQIRSHIASSDVILTWQGFDIFSELSPTSYQLGFDSRRWREVHVDNEFPAERVLTFQPYAPLDILTIPVASVEPVVDVAFFGTIWDSNIDHFYLILKPLADRHSYIYRGLRHKVPRALRKYGFRRKLVAESDGYDALLCGRVNISISHIAHREKQSVTERIFTSCAFGRPVVADNLGVHHFYRPDEVSAFDDSTAVVECVEWLLQHPREAEEMARKARKRTLEQYTYKESVGNLLQELRVRIGERIQTGLP